MEYLKYLLSIACVATLVQATAEPWQYENQGKVEIKVSPPLPQCTEDINNNTRTFYDLESYKSNILNYNINNENIMGNYVNFSGTFGKLPGFAFFSKESKYTVKLFLNKKGITIVDDAAFYHLDCLRQLDLEVNSIEKITERTFYPLPRLQHLNLSVNAIQEIDGEYFRELKELITLDLSFNKIGSIGKYSFMNLMELKYLNLSRNLLKIFDADTFSNTVSLKRLVLSYNQIKTTQYDEWRNLNKLQFLDLGNNNLKEFLPGQITCLKNLRTLYLNDNFLKALDVAGLRQNFGALRNLDINNNEFTCDSLLQSVLQLEETRILVVSNELQYSSNINGIYCVRTPEGGNESVAKV